MGDLNIINISYLIDIYRTFYQNKENAIFHMYMEHLMRQAISWAIKIYLNEF